MYNKIYSLLLKQLVTWQAVFFAIANAIRQKFANVFEKMNQKRSEKRCKSNQ